MHSLTTKTASLLAGAVLLHTQPVMADTSQVVTSIKPLELLVRAVATDDTSVTTLVPAGASPHTYQMKPSQRRALEDADRIFWVGPNMETFLVRLLSGEDFEGRQVALADEAGEPHDDQPHDDSIRDLSGEDAEEHEHHHGEGEDPHVWLNPRLALAMAYDIKEQLAQLPDADHEALDGNLARFGQELRETEQDIRRRLEATKDLSLFTYHDAFRRFAEFYGLEIAGVLTLSPERSPGARHMAELQQQLRNSPSPCLLTEPQFNSQWWRSITNDVEVTISTWDPLASDIPATPSGYVEFQKAMAEAVLNCLPEQAQN